MCSKLLPLPLLLTCIAVLFTGCAGNPPQGLEDSLGQAPTPRAVQAAPDRFLGQNVRWGGEILGLQNHPELTEVEVYARPLMENAEPRPDGGEGVRFIARVNGFLDPAEYRPGKRLTVRGPLEPALTRPVGEYPYLFPVVRAEVFHLWPVYQPPQDPYYNDPWGPWGPWGGWGPYRYHPYW